VSTYYYISVDILNASSIYKITITLSSFASSKDMCKLFEGFNISKKNDFQSTEGVSTAVLSSTDKTENELFDGLYAWSHDTRHNSISELAIYLISKEFTEEAYTIYPFCKFCTIC